jgi:hypothetical protein
LALGDVTANMSADWRSGRARIGADLAPMAAYDVLKVV